MTDKPIPLFDAWFGLSILPHWHLHAWLMFAIWIVLVPAVVALTRFGKPPPSAVGIPKGSPKFGRKLYWFTLHRVCLFVLTVISVVAGLMAVTASNGFSGTLHAVFGIGTLVLSALQVVGARWRGTHGGRDPEQGTPNRPVFTRGDHYDMTLRRRWFEACHKTVGYFALVCAIGAVATGLSQYWIFGIAIALGFVVACWLVIAIVLEAKGFRHDTYLSNFGTGAHHPFNKARIDTISGDGAT